MSDPASIIIGFLAGVIVAGVFYSFKLRSFSKSIARDLKCARQLNRIAEYLNKVGKSVHGASPAGTICIELMDFIYNDKPLIDKER